jgi:outer membrane lipopolysaccharide assembly protein LptE/RlpB
MGRGAVARVACALAACVLAPLAGCGYQLVRSGQLPGGGALRVLPFSNQTAQAELGGLFAAAARELLAGRGRLASEEDRGAAVLEGELLAVATSPSVLAAAGAQAMRVEATVRLRVLRGSGPVYQDTVGAGEDYLQGVDVLGTEANRRAALRRAADTALREAFDRMELASAELR